MISTIDRSQRRAAKIVGLAYLLALPPALFGETAISTALRHFPAQERLLRLGIAANLSSFAIDVALIAALYVALKPVGRGLALFAAFVGVIETGIFVVMTFNDLAVLRILSGPDVVRLFGAERSQALAGMSLGAHGAGYQVGLVLAGLRSAVFAWLWLESRFIPKALAAWGVFSSLVLTTVTFASIVFAGLPKHVPVAVYGGPIFIFELTMGFWLLFRNLRPAAE